MKRLIANIEFKIRNVYVRYEDNFSSPSQKSSGLFTVGVLLEELEAHTTGPDWILNLLTLDDNNFTHKVLKVTNLRVFLNFESPYTTTKDMNFSSSSSE